MTRRLMLLLLLGLLAYPVLAQPGPGLSGDRRWRAPIANAAALPGSGSLGEVRLTIDDGALHFWDGDSWQGVAGGGGSGEVNTASNLGGGIGLYSVKVGEDLRFNSLASDDFDLTENLISIDNTKWAMDSELPSGDAPHSRTVTVDAAGLGDYETIGEALAYVATQTRSESTQWLVLVYPGEAQPATGYADLYNYVEASPITVPSFTSLQGIAAGHETPASWSGVPIVKLTAAAGPAVTLQSSSSISNLRLMYYGEPAGALDVVATESTLAYGSAVVITNVVIEAWGLAAGAVTALVNADGGIALYTYETSLILANPTAGSALAVTSSESGTSLYGGRYMSVGGTCNVGFRSTGGALKFFWSRIDPDCETDLEAAGGTVRVIGTPYQTAIGTITHDDGTQGIQFCKTFSGTGSPEGSVSAPVCSSYWRRDGGAFSALYLKQSGSGNTGWVAGVDAAGNAECVTDDDVPEGGDFGALALTGDVTSSGLATTVAADAVALGTDTTGAYVAGATASQGLALTGSEAGTLGLMDCAANEIPKRNAGDTAWECASDSTGASSSGDVVGPASATDNALARFDGTTGKLIQNSSATLSDTGILVLPDGSDAATGLRFNSFAAGTGLFGNGSTTLSFSVVGVTRWSLSNSAVTSQNGSLFRNAGAGEPVFSPGNSDGDSGLGANASDDMAMYAGSGTVSRWLRVTSGVWRTLDVGQAADTPQAATCASSGDISPGAVTINPTTALVYITNSDPDGCAVTMGETNVNSGVHVQLVVTSSAGGVVAFSDTSGVTELAGALGYNAGLDDVLDLLYIADRWVETGRSDN
jgi:hypothetical protein